MIHSPLSPIFIAEDNDDDLVLFRRAARAAGLENPILHFRDGRELVSFLQKCGHNSPCDAKQSLLFVDLAMPVMSGFEVLKWLKDNERCEFLSVVLSGSKQDGDMVKAYELGAEEYLIKPLAPALLAALALRTTAMAHAK